MATKKTSIPEQAAAAETSVAAAPAGVPVMLYAPEGVPEALAIVSAKAWTKHLPGSAVKLLGSSTFEKAMAEAVALSDDRSFIFAPAGCLPLCPVDVAGVQLLKSRKGDRYAFLPNWVDPDRAAEILTEGMVTDAKAFFGAYAEKYFSGFRPLEIDDRSFFAGYCLREQPNKEAVQKAIDERLYLYVSPAAFPALEKMLKNQ